MTQKSNFKDSALSHSSKQELQPEVHDGKPINAALASALC